MVSVAVVGAGGWGKNHVRVWHELEVLALVCDPIDEHRQRAEDTHGVQTSARTADAFADGIDAVVLATPASTHADLACEALSAGKHVLVEKPMALTREDAREMQTLATQRGLTLMVNHVLEYHPAVAKLRAMVKEGELGRLLYVSSHRMNFGRVRTEEDALWSFAPHDLSLMVNMLGGMPTAVSCQGSAFLSEDVADVTLMNLEWPGGIRGYIFVSWLHPYKDQRFILVGDHQMAVFDDTVPWEEKLQLYPHRVDWMDGRVPVAHRADAIRVELEQAEPLKQAARHFLACIETGDEPRTGARNGIAVVELLEAGRRSLETRGATVPIGVPERQAAFFIHPTASVDEGAQIGHGTKVWHHTHVMPGAVVGRDVVLGQDTYVGGQARVGDGVRIENNVSVYDHVTLEDHAFVGPSVVFTEGANPRSDVERKDAGAVILVRRGATLGANSTIVCPVEIGEYAFVGAGAVVVRDVPAHALVVGNPARAIGWMCTCGERLDDRLACTACGRAFALEDGALTAVGVP